MPTTTDSLPHAASPQEDVTTTLYRAAIGPVSNAYYLPLFTRFEAADRASITWNTAASLLTLNWLLFRQLWGAALVYVGIVAGVCVFVLGIGRLVLHFSTTLQMALLLGFGVLAFVLPGLFGNVLLHAQCRKRMEKALAANAKIADACAELTAQASTHRRAVIQAGINVVLLILAVFLYVQYALFTNVAAMPQGALESGSVTQETPTLGITTSKHPLPAAAIATSEPASASVAPPLPALPASSAASSAASAAVAAAPALPATAPISVASAVAQVASQIATPASTPVSTPASSPLAPATAVAASMPVAALPKPVASAAAPAVPKPKASEAASRPAASHEKRVAPTPPAPKPLPKPAPKPLAKPATTAASAASAAGTASREPVKGAATRDKGYFVNVGLFSVPENARSVAERLRAANLEVQLKEFKSETKGNMIRVRVGPFITQEGAQEAVETIQGLRLEAVIVRQ